MRRMYFALANHLNNVAVLQAGLLGCLAGEHLADEHAVCGTELPAQLAAKLLHGHADEGAHHFAVLYQ